MIFFFIFFSSHKVHFHDEYEIKEKYIILTKLPFNLIFKTLALKIEKIYFSKSVFDIPSRH